MALLSRFWSSPHLLIAMCALLWSANSVVGRAVHDAIGPAALSFWRWAVAAMLMGALARRHVVAERAAIAKSWRLLFAAALFGVGAFGLLLYIGLGYTTAVNSLLMQTALPAVTMLIMFVVHGERPKIAAAAGSLVAIGGVMLIACRGSPAVLATLRLNPGDALTLGAICLYSFYTMIVARGPRLHPMAFAAVTFAFAAVALLPVWIIEMMLIDEPPVTLAALAAILFVALFPSCGAYLCYNRAVALAGPAMAGNTTLLMPLFGSLMAVVLLGERLAWFHFAGGAVIVAGILLTRRATETRTIESGV